jgi:hypothetical protein
MRPYDDSLLSAISLNLYWVSVEMLKYLTNLIRIL